MPTMLAGMEGIRLTCTVCDREIAPGELSSGLCPRCTFPLDCEALRSQADAVTD